MGLELPEEPGLPHSPEVSDLTDHEVFRIAPKPIELNIDGIELCCTVQKRAPTGK